MRLFGCPVFGTTASVSGNLITVTVQSMVACGTPVPIEGFAAVADLGVLPAGLYDFIAVSNTTPPFKYLETKLAVADANPPVTIEPNVVPVGGGEVAITNDIIHSCVLIDPCFTPSLKLDGIVVETWTWGPPPHTIIVQVPPHAAGPVDVTIEDNSGNRAVSHAALEYFDPNGPFDPAFFETVLLPVIINGPGAFGAEWATDSLLRNENDYRYPVSSIFDFCCLGTPGPATPPPHSTARVASFTSLPAGFAMFVPRQAATNVWFALLAKDLSRQAEALGTELPVVRERKFFDRPFQILNVPTDARFRVSLRLYRMDAGNGVRLRVLPLDGTDALIDDYIVLPLVSSGGTYTAASIGDLLTRYPQLAGRGPLRIEIGANIDRPIAWGFVSVTNNETQHVTVISPQ